MATRPKWITDATMPIPAKYQSLREQFGGLIASGEITFRDLKDKGLGGHTAENLIYWLRNGRAGDDVEPETTPTVEDRDDSQDGLGHYLQDSQFVYDADRDVYVTFLRSTKKPLVTSGDKHRSIARAYSNWDGEPSTLNEVARDFKIPRPWLIEYLRAHQITHDREPFSAQEVANRDVDEMVEDALQARRSTLYQQYNVEKWREIKADAKKWLDFENEALEAIAVLIRDNAPDYCVPRLRLPRAVSPFALVVGLTDFHWGAYSWSGETGHEYNREIAEQRLTAATASILSRLPGQPEKIILPVGSDFFHVDGYMASTTSGTPQDVEGTPTEILITGCEMTRLYIDLLRQVAPVEVVLMSGNHDRVNGISVLLFLSAWYRGEEDVNVVQDFRPRVYSEYGDTLLGFSHGDGAKPKDLGSIMATEAREAWGRTRHHVAFGGHLHHQIVTEANGITHYMMPSLASPDRWHAKNGFTVSSRGLCAYIVDKADGVSATLYSSGGEK